MIFILKTAQPGTFSNAASIINKNYEYEFLWRDGDMTIYKALKKSAKKR
ncbi:MAG: hypothetical protein LBH29_05780 [Elusimicrobiota bacterium]|jgi:hypothetical protein|nr:hypothetical protein [Elusimicrobiota bacterium]